MSTNRSADRVGLYVHIPFCVRKCPYCDFNTFDVEKQAIRSYLKALRHELQLIRAKFDPPAIDTLFLGGGTPTVLSGSQLADVIGWIHDAIGIRRDAEVTVEANPGSVTVNGLRAMVEAGVTRVSLGVQSFSDQLLHRIGRNHSVRDVLSSYDAIRTAGIGSVNFDLMFGLPGQTVGDWEKTLAKAVDLAPDHFSCYSLIIEEGTPFAALHKQGKLDLPADDDEVDMFEQTIEALVGAGYEHYEISNFALPGHRCRHNELYWRNKEWIAAGPGAHGHWQGRRYWNARELSVYEQRIDQDELPIAGFEDRSLNDQMDETIMLGLRLIEGIDLDEFGRRFSTSVFDVYGEIIDRLTAWELLSLSNRHLRLTYRGLMMGNRVTAHFLRDTEKPV